MSRSFAAAPVRGRATRPRSGAAGAVRPTFGLARRLLGGTRLARAGAAFAWRRRRLRVALLALAVAMPLLAGGWLWFRQSSFVAVEHVQVTGVHGAEAQSVESALVAAARSMSTLDIHTAALRAAVAPFRVVREVRAVPRFPHGLRIDVVEQLPVAALVVGDARTAVAADGVALGSALLSRSLPRVSASFEPAAGERLSAPGPLGALIVLGAAPAPLARLAESAFTGPRGITVAMRGGLLVYFGNDSLPHAKWLSLARVLADPGSAGASYVDVRLPSHPAAGFPAGVTAPDASSATGAGSGEAQASTESTVGSLAEGLSSGGDSPSTTGTEPPASAAGVSTGSSTSGEATSGETGAAGEPGAAQTPTTAEG